jgi:hypothetical protein
MTRQNYYKSTQETHHNTNATQYNTTKEKTPQDKQTEGSGRDAPEQPLGLLKVVALELLWKTKGVR